MNNNNKLKLCFLSNGPFGGFKSSMYALFSSLLDKGYDISLCLILKEDINVDLHDLDTRVNLIKKIVKSDGEKHIRNRKIYYPSIFYFYFMMYFKLLFKIKNKDFLRKYGIYYNQLFNKFYVKGIKEKIDLSEYDVVVSWEETFNNYLLADKIIAKKKIGFVHPDYIETGFSRFIDKQFFKKLDAICSVSFATKKSFDKKFPSLKKKSYAIPNLLDTKNIDLLVKNVPGDLYAKSNFDMITVCRFEKQHKALDRALSIAKRLADENIEYKWYFVGDGAFFNEMEHSIKEMHLQDNVILYGFKDNPFPYIKNADLFVLQSYYEGYPMCVLEALYIGIPCLLSNFSSANEIVKNNFNGFVVENNFNELYKNIKKIIMNKKIVYNFKTNLSRNDKTFFKDCSAFEKLILDMYKKKSSIL